MDLYKTCHRTQLAAVISTGFLFSWSPKHLAHVTESPYTFSDNGQLVVHGKVTPLLREELPTFGKDVG